MSTNISQFCGSNYLIKHLFSSFLQVCLDEEPNNGIFIHEMSTQTWSDISCLETILIYLRHFRKSESFENISIDPKNVINVLINQGLF